MPFQLVYVYRSRIVEFVSLQLYKRVVEAFYSFFLKAVVHKKYVSKCDKIF